MQQNRTRSSYKDTFCIAYKIAKSIKPFSDREFIKGCMIKASGIICPDIKHKSESVSLSWQTVTQRTECINENLNGQLISELQLITWYSFAL